MLVPHAVRPNTTLPLHRITAVAILMALILGACARSGDSKAGDSTGVAARPAAMAMTLTDFKEPLDSYPVADLYAACRAMPLHRAGQSGDYLQLRLVPLTTAIDSADGSWQSNGKFVGVVENRGTTFNAEYNVNGATSDSTPGVTCAWYGFEQGTTQLKLRLIGPDSIRSVSAVRDDHAEHHAQPLAEWRTSSGVPAPGNPPHLLADIPWWTCDQTGCCKKLAE